VPIVDAGFPALRFLLHQEPEADLMARRLLGPDRAVTDHDARPLEDPAFDSAFGTRIRDRDAAAWRELVRLCGPTLRRLSRVLLPPRLDPDNALAEVWFRAIKAAPRFDPEKPPLPWLLRICTNVCTDALRGSRSLSSLDEEAATPSDRSPDSAARAGFQETLRRAVHRLSRHEREVFVLRYLAERSPKETAAVLECEVSTVHRVLTRALESLRQGPYGRELRDWLTILRREGS
jgi:RNA polymerase sigma-70 factor (ECF subfamily)